MDAFSYLSVLISIILALGMSPHHVAGHTFLHHRQIGPLVSNRSWVRIFKPEKTTRQIAPAISRKLERNRLRAARQPNPPDNAPACAIIDFASDNALTDSPSHNLLKPKSPTLGRIFRWRSSAGSRASKKNSQAKNKLYLGSATD